MRPLNENEMQAPEGKRQADRAAIKVARRNAPDNRETEAGSNHGGRARARRDSHEENSSIAAGNRFGS